MSTTLKPIQALVEVPVPEKRESYYHPTELQLTRFSGGKDRGLSLQMGFEDENGAYHHVQLSKKGVNDLIDILREYF